MRLIKLSAKHFKQYKRLGPIYFPEKGTIGIVGLTGSGKTTIFNAIEMSLFGRISDIKMSDVKNKDSKKSDRWMTELVFEFNNIQYTVIRHQTTANSKLYANGDLIQTGQTNVTEHLENVVFRMGHNEFLNAFYAKQDELDKLSELRDAERKRLFSSLLNIDNIDKAIQLSRKDKNELDILMRELSRFLINESDLNKQIKEIENSLKEINKKSKEIDEEITIKEKKLAKIKVNEENFNKKRDSYNTLINNQKGFLERKKSQSNLLSRIIKERNELSEIEKKLKDIPNRIKLIPILEEKISKLDEYQRFIKENDARINTLQKQENRVKVLEKQFEKNDIAKLEKGLSDIEEQLKTKAEKINELNLSINEVDLKINNCISEGKKLRKQLSNVNKLGDHSSCPTCEQHLSKEHIVIISSKYNEELEKVKLEYRELEGARKKLNETKLKLNESIEVLEQRKLKGKKFIENLKTEINTFETELEILKSNKADYSNWLEQKKEITKIKFNQNSYDETKRELDQLISDRNFMIFNEPRVEKMPSLTRDIASIEKEIKSFDSEIENIKADLKKLGFDEKAFEEINNNKKELEESIKGLEREKNRINLIEVELKRDLKEVVEKIKENEKNKKLFDERSKKFKNLLYLDRIFQEFKVKKLSEIAPSISKAMSSLLDYLTDGKYDTVELDEDYNVYVYRNGIRQPQNLFSGGEKKIISLAQRLAISQIITQQRSTNNFDFLALDEVVGSLDEDRQFVVLESLRKLNHIFNQIFMITHNQELNATFDYNLVVEEDSSMNSIARWGEDWDVSGVKDTIIEIK